MYTVEKLNLKRLTKKQSKIYHALLHPAWESPYFPLGLLDPKKTSQIALAALENLKPIALLVASEQTGEPWQIHSFYIEPEHRDKGLEEKLLKKLEKELPIQAKMVVFNYKFSDSPYFDPHLEKLGWEGKRPVMADCFYDNIRDFHPPWFEKPLILPPEFEIFFWKELKPEESELIKNWANTRQIPPIIDPFQGDGSFEPTTSLGLRYNGEIVGWMVNRLLPPSTLLYLCFYMRHDLQSKGYSMQLLKRSIQLQQMGPIKSAYFFVNFLHSRLNWLEAVEKHLAPVATKFTLYLQAWKTLKN